MRLGVGRSAGTAASRWDERLPAQAGSRPPQHEGAETIPVQSKSAGRQEGRSGHCIFTQLSARYKILWPTFLYIVGHSRVPGCRICDMHMNYKGKSRDHPRAYPSPNKGAPEDAIIAMLWTFEAASSSIPPCCTVNRSSGAPACLCPSWSGALLAA